METTGRPSSMKLKTPNDPYVWYLSLRARMFGPEGETGLLFHSKSIQNSQPLNLNSQRPKLCDSKSKPRTYKPVYPEP